MLLQMAVKVIDLLCQMAPGPREFEHLHLTPDPLLHVNAAARTDYNIQAHP